MPRGLLEDDSEPGDTVELTITGVTPHFQAAVKKSIASYLCLYQQDRVRFCRIVAVNRDLFYNLAVVLLYIDRGSYAAFFTWFDLARTSHCSGAASGGVKLFYNQVFRAAIRHLKGMLQRYITIDDPEIAGFSIK